MTFLIVDDDANDRLLLLKELEGVGFDGTALAVNGGQEALNYLMGIGQYAERAKFPLPDVIILDLVMPDISGTDVLIWLKTQPEIAAIPVFVLSGFPYGSAVTEAYRLGAKTFFVKPLEGTDLQALLREAARYAQKPPLPEPPDTPSTNPGNHLEA